MDNQIEEFQDSTLNLSNTKTELNSTQQGYIKAITKLVRSIERAYHHIQLLTTAIDKRKPPRGLIPKMSPKIPDTPGKFIIKWEGIQQETGLHLTQAQREYWIDRSNQPTEELDPIKDKASLGDFPCTVDQDTRNNRQHLQRNHPGTEEEEEYHQNISRPSRSTTTEKTKHQRRLKRTLTHNIISLSRYQLTPGEISLLSKGLNFIPRPNKEHPAKPLQDILLFDGKLRLKYFFYQDTTTETVELTEDDNTHNDILHPSS